MTRNGVYVHVKNRNLLQKNKQPGGALNNSQHRNPYKVCLHPPCNRKLVRFVFLPIISFCGFSFL